MDTSMTAVAVNMVCRFLSTENDNQTYSALGNFPPELLELLFTHLPARQVIRCREVCVRWKQLIDDLSDGFWAEKCSSEYRFLYNEARIKSSPSLSLRDMYISLSTWPNLSSAEEVWSELPSEGYTASVHAWKGTIGTHKKDSVIYYDIEKRTQVNKIDTGEFMDFQENEDVVAYLHYNDKNMRWFRQLRIIPKVGNEVIFENMITHDNVNNFIIFDNKVYYNQWKHNPNSSFRVITEMYVCDIKESLKCTFLQNLTESVWVFGGTEECLTYASSRGEIFQLINGQFISTDRITRNEDGSFKKLNEHNLTLRANFENWVMDSISITNRVPLFPEAIRVYGNIVFFGSKTGVFKIFDHRSLSIDVEAKPIKMYDLKAMFKLEKPRIKGIDVIEVESGHVIVISTSLKIMMLKFNH